MSVQIILSFIAVSVGLVYDLIFLSFLLWRHYWTVDGGTKRDI